MTLNMFKKKDSIEGVDLNQQPGTIAKFLIVIGNTALWQHFGTTNASITISGVEWKDSWITHLKTAIDSVLLITSQSRYKHALFMFDDFLANREQIMMSLSIFLQKSRFYLMFFAFGFLFYINREQKNRNNISKSLSCQTKCTINSLRGLVHDDNNLILYFPWFTDKTHH